MAAQATGGAPAHLVFHSRAVRIAGTVEAVFGLVILIAGVGLGVSSGVRNALPLGLVVGVLGVVLLLSGLARITARMEVSRTQVTWTWSFSRHHIDLEDLDDAALVEKGAPAPGGAWAGFLGGGVFAVVAWWLVDACWAFVSSEPSLGSVELIVVKHHGGPVSVKPIGAWSTRSSHSEANQALHYLQAAIASSGHRAPVAPDILRTDAWEWPGEH